MRRVLVALLLALPAFPGGLAAQAAPRADDVATPAAIVLATYAAINRPAGEDFDWDGFRSLFLPGATLIPNVQQTGGAFRPLTVDAFIEWIDGATVVGGPSDRGFFEEEVHNEIREYGTIAQVFSFVPPAIPFAMALRLAAEEPVPIWQIAATLVWGTVCVLGMIWMAAKIFRVGVLMYGKPPSLLELLKWLRYT